MTGLLAQLRRRAGDERGAALILVAVGLPAFIAFGIFAIDVGNWWVHKRHLQTQADAAALAGAREFRFPACNDKAIVEEAVNYSGGVLADPDLNFTTFDGAPLNYNHQLAASARLPAGPTAGIHTQVNTPDPWDGAHPADRRNDGKWVDDDPADPDDGDLRDMAPADRKPCTAQMVDVKVTETDLVGRFSPLRFLNVFGFVDFIDARARVELRALEETTDLMPLAVEDVNPKTVRAWLYDEDTGESLGSAELEPHKPDEDGLLIYSNDVSDLGTPIPVDFNSGKRRVGAVIGFSGGDAVDCPAAGDPPGGTYCYGTPADGVTRIRGYRTFEGTDAASCLDAIDNDGDGAADEAADCRGVRLGAVAIISDPAVCGTHDNGYFSTTCAQARLAVDLPGFEGADAATNSKSVEAVIHSGNGTESVDLHWVAATGRWETTGTDRLPIELGEGTQKIDIEWEQAKGTLDLGGSSAASCTNKPDNPCHSTRVEPATWIDVHKAFSGANPVSGPLKEVRVDIDPLDNVNNVRRCAAAESCPQAVVVRVGIAGRLQITPRGAPPVSLRISASGPSTYQTKQLNCQPSGQTPSGRNWTPRNTDQEFAYGCEPVYRIKEDLADPCPSKATLHGSENPPAWDCVAVKTGELNGPVGAGLNERILCAPPNPDSNCTQFGKPVACTSPNRYPKTDADPNYPENDTRILDLFLVPYGSLDFAGAGTTVPVIRFAQFYVTGWHSKGGGFDNPCAAPGAAVPDVFSPDVDPNDSGVVSGYFINDIQPNVGGSGDAACDPDEIGGCVAVMTK
jgi:hypothetical protein